MKKPKPFNLNDIQDVSPGDLNLDNMNPRLVGKDYTIEDQLEILRSLWLEREVSELVDSISINGYWKQEVLFATEENGKLIVVEGNRRLAAVKLLISPELCEEIGAKGVPSKIPAAIAQTYKKLPVIICARFDLWMYMGFKHLNGPREWDSIAKAEYIFHVYEDFHIPLREIASKIGDQHDTVKRLYHGLAVLNQAEKSGVFKKENAWGKRFPYSHLWTGLGYSNFQKFLGIKPSSKEHANPIPHSNISRLGDLCTWLFGSKNPPIKPLIKSQNPDLRKLNEVLGSTKGVAALNRLKPSEDLDSIWRFSRGDELMLRESLVAAERALREASSYSATGYVENNKELLQQGRIVQKLSNAIVEQMQNIDAGAGIKE